MITNLHYAYLIGDIFMLFIWAILFLVRPDLRKQMLTMSLIAAIAGPFSEIFYLRDYWHPILFNGWPVGIEDVLFGFAIGGIAAVLYEELFGKTYALRKRPGRHVWTLGTTLIFIGWMILSTFFIGLNSIYASIMGFVAFGAVIVLLRHDLLQDAVMSGVVLGSLMLLMYAVFTFIFPDVIRAWWEISHISGVTIWGAPLEELLWAFSWGFCGGPLYEFATGLTLKNR